MVEKKTGTKKPRIKKKKSSPKSKSNSMKLVIDIPEGLNEYDVKEAIDLVYTQPNIDANTKILTAHDILTKSAEDLDLDKRELHNLVKRMKILTAILLGKQQNKDLSKVFDTDKSFTSKQIKELESAGLVKRETEGREVKYEVDRFNLLKFLNTKVTIKWKKEEDKK